LRGLFLGDLEPRALLPFPTRPKEEIESTEQVVGAVSDFARDRIDARRIDEDGKIPKEVLDGLRELGLFGMLTPAEYGGLGFGATTYCRVLERLCGHCTSCAATVGAHQSIGLKPILLFGSEDQKRRWLPHLASGDRLAAFALTEPGAGSDVQSLATIADPTPDGGFKIRGSKIWITNGGIASLYTVFAKTPDPENPNQRKISCFVVPRDAPGVTVGKEEEKMGLRGSSTTAIFFEDVVVPRENLIGDLGRGFKVAVETLNSGRHGLAAGCLGVGRAALADATAHARARQQFGKPIIEFPLVQEMLANAAADLFAIEAGCYWVAGRIDAGAGDVALEAAACKIFATESLWRITNDCLQVAGGSGFMREFAHERRVRDARVNLIFEGTNQILRLFLALQGVRGPGEELKNLGAAIKNPVGGFGVLAGAARRRWRQTWPPRELAGISHEWRAEASEALEASRDFAVVAREAVWRHRQRIVDAQLVLAPLADAASHLFLQWTALAHLSSDVVAHPPEAVARLALRRLLRGFRRALAELRSADAPLMARAARDL
jgi:acyl-CoA dehydrogenase family protein 9